MKHVLVVSYSQSGQLQRVADTIAAPIVAAGHRVDTLTLEPLAPYPFPWRFWEFFDAFPESVWLEPPPLKPWSVPAPRYDLVLLCWSPWFLSPAPPTTAFLQSAQGRALLAGTPVVTVTANRGMWVQAQEQVKALLAAAGARHCDHVALVDPHRLASFVTTPRWLMTGRREPFWGLPGAGVPEAEVARAGRFGRALAAALSANRIDGTAPVLAGLGAAQVDPALLASEKIGRRSFRVWGKIVRSAGGPGAPTRRPVLAVYLAFLVLMIVTVVPVSLLLRFLLRPLMHKRLAALAAEYERPSGSGTGRLKDFS